MTIGAQKQSEDNGNSDREGESFDRGGKQPTFFFGFSLCRFAATIVASVVPLSGERRLCFVHSLTCLAARRAPTALVCCAPGADLRACERMVAFEKRGFEKKERSRGKKKAVWHSSFSSLAPAGVVERISQLVLERQLSVPVVSRLCALSVPPLSSFAALFSLRRYGFSLRIHCLHSRGHRRASSLLSLLEHGGGEAKGGASLS